MVDGGRVPIAGPDGKIRERHLPPRLTQEQFDPEVELVELFEQTLAE